MMIIINLLPLVVTPVVSILMDSTGPVLSISIDLLILINDFDVDAGSDIVSEKIINATIQIIIMIIMIFTTSRSDSRCVSYYTATNNCSSRDTYSIL